MTQELAKTKIQNKKFVRRASIFLGVVLSFFFIIAFIFMITLNRGLPSITHLKDYKPKTVTVVYSQPGEVVAEFFEEYRFVVQHIPEKIRLAFVAAEDAHFYTHKGVDFFGIVRAAWANFLSGGIRQGASTITQQVARSFLLSSEKTYTRKLKEAILAWQIENYLTKEEILHLYLNHIYLGHGAYGVAAAARVYFNKDLKDLMLAETAILAGLPKAPSRYSPQKNPDRVKRRQLYVLKQMLRHDFITPQEYEEAAMQDVFVMPVRDITKTVAPYFSEWVRQYLIKKYGAEKMLQEGLQVYTTVDVDWTRYGQNALRKGLSDLEKRQGYRGPLKTLKSEEIDTYFKGRKFEERDEEKAQVNQELEVSRGEVKDKGLIRMQLPKQLESGDWLEGVVIKVDDTRGEALVEYEPSFYARLVVQDMRWATKRIQSAEDEEMIRPVEKVSNVLQVGDVILMTVKEVHSPLNQPLLAQLEQHTEVEGALLALDPENGYVKVMIGGYDFKISEFNRSVQAKRQPGSAFKPIIYAAALDLGFTPSTILQDSPLTFENPADQEKWRPSNYDEKFLGDVSLRTSLLMSRNVTTIRLLNEVGLDTVIQYAKQLGIKSELTKDFTLALGSSSVTLWELIQPYMVFATGGYRREPMMIKRVIDREGQVLEENILDHFNFSTVNQLHESFRNMQEEAEKNDGEKGHLSLISKKDLSFLQEAEDKNSPTRKVVTSPLLPGQVLSSEASFLMANLLKENVLYGTGRGARVLNRTASGKTGTTDENRDAWFLGFTPHGVAGVWVGYDDQRILGRHETGSRAAVPIWTDFMFRATLLDPKSDFRVPENIEFAKIDPKTGQLASSETKNVITEAYVKGTAPTQIQEKKPDDLEEQLYE